MRCQPVLVADVSTAVDPTHPELVAGEWQEVARMYATGRPPTALLERPAEPDGHRPPLTLMRDGPALIALARLCGVTPGELDLVAQPPSEDQPAGEQPSDHPPQVIPVAQAASQFTRVTRVQVTHFRAVAAATAGLIAAAGDRQHWLLEGEQTDRAVPVSVDQLGTSLAAILKGADDDAGTRGRSVGTPEEH
jgi:hypothetical protein